MSWRRDEGRTHGGFRRRHHRHSPPGRRSGAHRCADHRDGPRRCVGRPGAGDARHRHRDDHEVPVDGEHPARPHHESAGHGVLPRHGHRGSGESRFDPARDDRRHRFCTSLAGEELGRILSWGTSPARHADYAAASPTLNCDVPQNYLEPILVRNATARGTQTRFSSEYLSHVQDDAGVTVRVLDRVTGRPYEVRAKYVIAADGARSRVVADLDLPMEGRMDIAGSMNITFTADIDHLVGHRPSVLYWVVQPGSNVGGNRCRPDPHGAALERMAHRVGIRHRRSGTGHRRGAAVQIVRNLIGDPDLEVTITGTSLWGTTRCTPHACRRDACSPRETRSIGIPPSNGLGSNTSIQTPTTSPGSSPR